MFRKILKLLIVLILSILIGNMAYGMYQEFNLKDGPNVSSLANTEWTQGTLNTEKEEKEIKVIEKIQEQYKG